MKIRSAVLECLLCWAAGWQLAQGNAVWSLVALVAASLHLLTIWLDRTAWYGATRASRRDGRDAR